MGCSAGCVQDVRQRRVLTAAQAPAALHGCCLMHDGCLGLAGSNGLLLSAPFDDLPGAPPRPADWQQGWGAYDHGAGSRHHRSAQNCNAADAAWTSSCGCGADALQIADNEYTRAAAVAFCIASSGEAAPVVAGGAACAAISMNTSCGCL